MNYNLPFEVDLILNRFRVPLYVASTYTEGDGFIPPASASTYSFDLPWNVILDSSASTIETDPLSVEVVVYQPEPKCLDLIVSRDTRNDPNCTYTMDRIGPGLLEADPFSSDYVSRSAKLPDGLNEYYAEQDITPLEVPGRNDDFTMTPVMTVCRDNALQTIFDVATNAAGSDTSTYSYFYLRDEPPSRLEFPDLSTFTSAEIDGEQTYCYYDAKVTEVTAGYSDYQVTFDEPISGLIILKLARKQTISGYREEEAFRKSSHTIHYIYAPYPIKEVYLSDSRPIISSYTVEHQFWWNIVVKNLYNETSKTAVQYDDNAIQTHTDISSVLFDSSATEMEMPIAYVDVNGTLHPVTTEMMVTLNSTENIISGVSSNDELNFEGAGAGEELYIETEIV